MSEDMQEKWRPITFEENKARQLAESSFGSVMMGSSQGERYRMGGPDRPFRLGGGGLSAVEEAKETMEISKILYPGLELYREGIESLDSKEVRKAVREFLANFESSDIPHPEQISWFDNILSGRITQLENELKKMEKEKVTEKKVKETLVEKAVVSYELRIDEARVQEFKGLLSRLRGRSELEVSMVEEDGVKKAILSEEDVRVLERSQEGRTFLYKERVIYTKGKLNELIKELQDRRQEFVTRVNLNKMWELYSQSMASLSKLAKLGEKMSDSGVEIKVKHWRHLFDLPETVDGDERLGVKIENALRIITLIAFGGGGRIDQMKSQIEKQPDAVKNLFASKANLDNLVKIADKNLFCGGRSEQGYISDKEIYEEIVNFVANLLGKDKGDNYVAANWAWRIFKMMGLNSHFAYKKENNRLIPASYPFTDDLVKLFHFESYRAKKAGLNHRHGPDATLGYYPPGLMDDFFHITKLKIGDTETTLWKEWFQNKKSLSSGNTSVDWEQIGDGAWESYISTIMFSAALYDILTKGDWKPEELMNIDQLRGIIQLLDKTNHAWQLREGEKREDAARKMKLNLLIGAVISDYQNDTRSGAATRWGIFALKPALGVSETAVTSAYETFNKRLTDAKFGVSLDEVNNGTKSRLDEMKSRLEERK